MGAASDVPQRTQSLRYGTATPKMAAVCHMLTCGKVTDGFQSYWRKDQVAGFRTVVGIAALCGISAYQAMHMILSDQLLFTTGYQLLLL